MTLNEPVEDGLDHVRMLADVIGKRPTGSDAEVRAADYLCAQLQGWGLAGVGAEPFAARSWDFSRCQVVADGVGPLESLPVEFSASTSAAGLTAPLVVCESPSDVALTEVDGRVVLVLGGLPPPSSLLERGAAGLILANSGRPRAWHEVYGPAQPLAGALPMVSLGFADAVELVRRNVHRVTLHVATTIANVTGRNVVATLPAAGPTTRRINVSGHYDSVPASGAAADNATGTACAMEVVHALSRRRPEVHVDLVIFSAEEIGLNGAAAYARAHADDLSRTELGIYFDGQGDFLGRHNIHAMGRAGLADWVRAEVAQMGYRADVHHHFTGLDQVFLSARGVPTLWFQRGPQLTWHTRADASADVSPEAMRQSIAAAVGLVRLAAASPGCLPGGIDDDQAQRIRDYVARGAPVW